jgi:hypothetical protein
VAQHAALGTVARNLSCVSIENCDSDFGIVKNRPEELVGRLNDSIAISVRVLFLLALAHSDLPASAEIEQPDGIGQS